MYSWKEGQSQMDDIAKAVTPFHQAHVISCVEELVNFVRIPNNVFDPAQIQANAQALRRMMERRDIQVELWQTASGRPLVFGELPSPGATHTVLVYGHYDGVPVEPDQWHSSPYDPVLRTSLPTGEHADWRRIPFPDDGIYSGSWRLFGRSVADSKNAIVAMLSALDCLRDQGLTPGVHLKFLFDGEEEVESPGLPACLEAHATRLRTDFVISASGETHQSGLPTVELGVRGMLQFDLEVYTTTVDMHSGHFGNFAPNAVFQLAELLSSLKGASGRVQVSGFYDGVVPLSDSEVDAIQAIPHIEDNIQRQFGIATPEVSGRTLQELINLPTLNVRGMSGGYVGESARNLIPSQATAEFDVRLVKGMDPSKTLRQIEAHITEQGWFVLDREPSHDERIMSRKIVKLTRKAAFPATRTPLDSPVAAMVVRAVKRAVGDNIVVMPTEGGSLPLYLFEQMGMPMIGLPTSNFDCNQHTHDENLSLDHFFRAIEIFTSLFMGCESGEYTRG
jgi:acetylornithine deacetylase/succinyl-diaminopimelate desuccinylase-like protein